MMQLTLYTTLGCHLCERLEVLLDLLHDGEYFLKKVEISEDEVLMARYGVRIPVLVDTADDELDMGFEPQRLADWLSERGALDAEAWRRLQEGRDDLREEERKERKAPACRPAGRRYLA
ncbi:glutaredoxin family protein [Halomonas sp. MCCC 1A11036]|uniref:Glutaredoxin family protein n=1 Tax=Billgrantia zhangzhouensis TaxID=2733481 RepID=A0ABS9AEL4_9GAMM|nr:glutaredoxin family protein [Halomonas zhangzhouensis]MCE8020193.1 glutaredoxin family protein [Halomonas zhangzhouensis]